MSRNSSRRSAVTGCCWIGGIRRMKFLIGLLSCLTLCVPVPGYTVTVGSKKFTENVILAEIITHLMENRHIPVQHKRELGGTRILWDALLHGDLDIYPEYTGTLIQELLANEKISGTLELRSSLSGYGIGMSRPVGFNNTYVLGMSRSRATALGIDSISDLTPHPRLRLGFSNEFLARRDGWPGLKNTYHLPQDDVRGMDHDLAYRALDEGTVDVMDLYATDAEIAYYDILPLRDDLNYFPEYQAVYIFRKGLLKRYPAIGSILDSLSGSIDSRRMAAMNAAVKVNKISEGRVAADFIHTEFDQKVEVADRDAWQSFRENTIDHLVLVGLSLGAAIFVSIPLGILAARKRRLGQLILGAAGIIQTIPSLALLVFMIPLLGVGGPPAVLALFLYSLLPIIRNTYTGLQDIPHGLIESSIVLGLPSGARLRLIELPLAMRSILSGIKISAVINVGTATLGGLIGAGGYGQPILTGIRLNDISLILQGAVPAAMLALLVQGLFELIEYRLLPRGLRS